MKSKKKFEQEAMRLFAPPGSPGTVTVNAQALADLIARVVELEELGGHLVRKCAKADRRLRALRAGKK